MTYKVTVFHAIIGKRFFRNGQHRAYTELFNLVENRRKARIAAGPGSEMSLEIKLENENNYLDKLKENLCAGNRTWSRRNSPDSMRSVNWQSSTLEPQFLVHL